MTRYQLAFAPFLNKYIDDELSKHYGGRRVTGVLPGLQNQCGAWYVPGGFDSHMSPPKERKKNMGMNQTPVSERVHIGFFGKRNAGKSSVMNAVTGQDLAVVSDVKGTTTDPVYKTMELLPLGPVVMMDTPGIDDEGELGELRVKKSYQVLNKTDIAVVVIDGTCGVSEEDLKITERIQKKNISYIIVLNKCERFTQEDERLREELGALKGKEEEERKIVGDLLEPSDFVVLVVPIDSAAPKGRLILPQQQTIRDILDADASAIVVKETELTKTLASLGKKPKMVITDSQVFGKVAKDTPKDILLTSFSILFARYKGNLETMVRGVKALDSLRGGDKVLISEGCTHHRQCDDIGTVKIPRWLKEYTGKELIIETSSGTEFPDDLGSYKMIIHCGGCMLNEREMKYRISCAQDQGIPIANYGMVIAYIHGILKRSLSPFPEIEKLL